MIRLPQDLSEAVEQGATVLVPSRQRAETARLAYAAAALAKGQRTWNTPDILPVETWFAREIERRAAAGERLPRLLTPAESWLLWRQATEQLTSDVDLVAPGALADALSRSSQLASEFGIDIERMHGLAGTEIRLLADAQRMVTERSRALGAASVAQLIGAGQYVGDTRPLVIAGFGHVSPRLAALAEQRRARGFVTRVRTPDGKGRSRPHAIVASDPIEEVERIAEWCRTKMEAQPDSRLLVMLSGSPAAHERLVTLIRQTLNPRAAVTTSDYGADATALASIEGGEPLARASLVAHALTALSWLTRGGEFDAWSEWLRGPYWATPDFAARSRIELIIRERGSLELNLRELLPLLREGRLAGNASAQALAQQLTEAATLLDAPSASPRQWAERFHAALAALRWPGSRILNSDEQQTAVRFRELLDEFGALAAQERSIPRGDAVRWLSELATRVAFRPATGDAPITLSSQLADPVVRYDGIWVAGLHADVWPAPAHPDPFLPLAAQLEAGVPRASATGQATESAELLSAWRVSADELMLSAPSRIDDVHVAPSPLLREWLPKRTPRLKTSLWLPTRVRREGMIEVVQDDRGLPWPPSVPLPGTRTVELQNKCPFRAYAELRLGCEDLRAPEPGVAADKRGRLLHRALEYLWKELREWRVLADKSPETLDALIGQCVREAGEKELGWSRSAVRRPIEDRECRRAQRLIRQLCELERKRTPFHVSEVEVDRTLPIAGTSMRVRIDRLDDVGDGRIAILDYKSGRASSGDWYSERPSHPQLLAYLAAVGQRAAAMATVAVTAREVRFDGIAATADLLPRVRAALASEPGAVDAWGQRHGQWTAIVERLVSDFLEGRAFVDPMPNACMFCAVVSVCRIGERKDYAVEVPIDE